MATIELDGTIRLLGRGSGCINTGGEKVYPEEVEGVVKTHPAVYDVVVVGVDDERWGQRVAAVVEAVPGYTLSLDELAAFCRASLAGYKIPRIAVHGGQSRALPGRQGRLPLGQGHRQLGVTGRQPGQAGRLPVGR